MIGLASTWMPEPVEQMTTVIRAQCARVGAQQGLSPMLDITRDPRWGRTEESFGEDPTLAAQLGVAYVRGSARCEPARRRDGDRQTLSGAWYFRGRLELHACPPRRKGNAGCLFVAL